MEKSLEAANNPPSFLFFVDFFFIYRQLFFRCCFSNIISRHLNLKSSKIIQPNVIINEYQ